MTSEMRGGLLIVSALVAVIGVWLAFGAGIALIVLGLGGVLIAVGLSYLAVTERPGNDA